MTHSEYQRWANSVKCISPTLTTAIKIVANKPRLGECIAIERMDKWDVCSVLNRVPERATLSEAVQCIREGIVSY
jgi:hypothetical protein